MFLTSLHVLENHPRGLVVKTLAKDLAYHFTSSFLLDLQRQPSIHDGAKEQFTFQQNSRVT
jgi:hypothetical protein